jgi:hypothetical protein
MAGAGNTRSPKLGVSRGGGRDLSLSHDGQREPPRRRKHPGRLCEPPALVRREVDHALGITASAERSSNGSSAIRARVGTARGDAKEAFCFGELLWCDVDVRECASGPHLRCGREPVRTGAAASSTRSPFAGRPSQVPPRRSHSAPVAAAAVARGGSIAAAERDRLSKNSETIRPRTGNAIAVANAS